MARALSLLAFAAALAACSTICPSGTDPRADPEGQECGTADDCLVRCACHSEGDELEIFVGDCQGGVCRGAEDLCEDGCGDLELVAYCRPPE